MEGFCRGCLIRFDDPAKLLPYTEKNRRLFIYCTGIKVNVNEVDTFQLCKDCHTNLKLSCKFKKQCRISDKKYKHYLSLKEVGDAFDLTTFLKSNDESLRFPLLSGSSTPNQRAALEREKDDDNDSTCTSIRNFMTDILQGEEMPDTEAHIIKEVIDETNMLDDTLDSQWLQDDNSRDTDFKDLSFSPFSTPHSIQLDHCYTPIKQIEANIINYNNTSDQSLLLTTYKEGIDEQITEIKQDETEAGDVKTDDNDSLFDEIAEQNVNYITQNENDIAVTNSNFDNIGNETYYAAKGTQNDNEQCYTNRVLNQDELAVKYLLESNKDNNHVASDSQPNSYFSTGSTKYVDVNQIQNERIEISFTLNQGSEVKEHKEENVIEPNRNHSLNHDQLLDYNVKITPITASGGDNKEDVVEVKSEIKIDLKINDLIVSPTESSVAPGASTPIINNILFGERLNDDNDNNIEKVKKEDEDRGDILDEILKHGVKELSIHTAESQAADVYDVHQLYCKSCNKKFKILKGLKIHLSRFHGIKLPETRARDFDTRQRICDICGANFKQFKSFQIHMQLHSDKTMNCPKCLVSFISELQLKRHMKTHDKAKTKDNDKVQTALQKYVCTVCGKVFTSSGNLAIHKKRHTAAYTVTCEECGKGFYKKTDLVNHMRVHTKDQPYQCKICGIKYTAKYTLLKHTKRHIGDTPYECDTCSKKYVLKSDLIRHIQRAKNCIKIRAGLSTKKPVVYRYQCAYCRNKFSKKGEFVRHQKNFKPCATLQNSKLCLVIDGTKTKQAEIMDIEMKSE